jgi:putative glutamine amidotransferase
MDQKILQPGRLKVVGLYFEAEKYNYDGVIEDFPEIGFHMISDTLRVDEIFRENMATEEFKRIFNYSRGIIFNGGPDIPPAVYGEETMILTSISDPHRHYFELSLLFHILGGFQNEDFKPFIRKRPKYSLLGICLGMQSMNVASGGTLIQDIPLEVYGQKTVESVLETESDQQHRNYYTNFRLYPEIPSYFLHPIEIVPGRWLSENILNSEDTDVYVLSSHHQAIEKLGKDFRVSAFSKDGKIIEAIEHVRYPNVVGLQFHPEIDYIFQDKKIYQIEPEGDKFSLRQEMKIKESLDFHISLWKAFSNSL